MRRSVELTEAAPDEVRLAVTRGQGLVRAAIRIAFGLPLFLPAVRVLPNLHFTPSAVSNRLPDYGWAVIVVTIAVAGAVVVWQGMRWLLFGAWPGKLAIVADADGLSFALGNLGTRRFDWQRMEAVYRFELSAEVDDMALAESLEPEEEMALRLPILRHPEAAETLNVWLERHAVVDERTLAEALRPFIEMIRRRKERNA